MIITDDVDFITFCKLILWALPDIANMIIPICFLLSSMYIFHKMRTDQEIVVMMTSGKSNFNIARPFLLLATLLSITMYYMQANLTPISCKHLINIQHKIRNKVSMSIIKPGVFNILGSSLVYVGSKTNNSLDDVFISYIAKDSHTNIITAKKGSYQIENNQMFITLNHGFRQVLDGNNDSISTFNFDSFSYDITSFVKRYSKYERGPHEKTQKELFHQAKAQKELAKKTELLAEAHGRYLISLLPIIDALIISLFLIVATHKERLWVGLAKAFSLGIIAQIGMISVINLSKKSITLINYNYLFIGAFIILLWYLAFIRRANAA